MPSPTCTVNATSTTGGVTVTAGATLQAIALADVTGVETWSITCVGTDDSTTVAAVNATLVVNSVAKTATFTAPSGAGSAVRFQSVVNGGLDANGAEAETYTTTFIVHTLINGLKVTAAGETTEANAATGWAAKNNAAIRAIASNPASVTAFGAVGDGTTDDTAAIQAAFDASATVVFPDGNFVVTSQITIDHPLVVRGSGQTTIIPRSTSTGTVKLFSLDSDDIAIDRIDVSYLGEETRYEGTRYLFYSQGTSVANPRQNISITNCKLRDVMTGGFVPLSLSNLGYRAFTAAASVITLNAHGFSNGKTVGVRKTAGSTLPAGLTVGTLYYVVNATANTFQVSLTSGGSPVAITSAGSGTFDIGDNLLVAHGVYFNYVADCDVSGCTISDVSGFGVHFEGCTNGRIAGNTFDDTGWASVNVYAGNGTTLIEGNRFLGTTPGRRDEGGAIDCPSNGSNLDGPNVGLIIRGNYITGWVTYGDGIRCGSCSNTIIEANVIDGVYGTMVSSPSAGISFATRQSPTVQAPCTNVRITGNILIASANANQIATGQAAIYCNGNAGWLAFTTNAATDVFTCGSPTGILSGVAVVVRNRGGALPTGLSAGTTYYAWALTSTTFKLTTDAAGLIFVDCSDAGSGTTEFAGAGALLGVSEGLIIEGNHIISPDASHTWGGGIWVTGGDNGWRNVSILGNKIQAFCQSFSVLPGFVCVTAQNASALCTNVHIKNNTCALVGATDGNQIGVYIGQYADRVHATGNIADSCAAPGAPQLIAALATNVNAISLAPGVTGRLTSPDTFSFDINGVADVGSFNADGVFYVQNFHCYFDGVLRDISCRDVLPRDVYLSTGQGLYMGGSAVRTFQSLAGVIVTTSNGSGFEFWNQNKVAKVAAISETGAIVVQNKATMYSGTGSPNGVVTGSVGDIFLRTDGGAGTGFYVKESGSASNTGWVAK